MIRLFLNLFSSLATPSAKKALALKGGELGIWNMNFITGEVYYDERSVEMLGYSPGEIPYKLQAWASLLHPADVEMMEEKRREHVQGRSPIFEAEYRLRMKSGDWKCMPPARRLQEARPRCNLSQSPSSGSLVYCPAL